MRRILTYVLSDVFAASSTDEFAAGTSKVAACRSLGCSNRRGGECVLCNKRLAGLRHPLIQLGLPSIRRPNAVSPAANRLPHRPPIAQRHPEAWRSSRLLRNRRRPVHEGRCCANANAAACCRSAEGLHETCLDVGLTEDSLCQYRLQVLESVTHVPASGLLRRQEQTMMSMSDSLSIFPIYREPPQRVQLEPHWFPIFFHHPFARSHRLFAEQRGLHG